MRSHFYLNKGTILVEKKCIDINLEAFKGLNRKKNLLKIKLLIYYS